MKKCRKLPILVAAFFMGIVVVVGKPLQVFAADASVTFGSNWYEWEEGEIFPVGVYINGETGIGEYEVTIQYDTRHMEYVDGAEEADIENGFLTLTGTGTDDNIKYWLRFRAIDTGEVSLTVAGAFIYPVDIPEGEEEREAFHITRMGSAPIRISGNDTGEEEGTTGEEAQATPSAQPEESGRNSEGEERDVELSDQEGEEGAEATPLSGQGHGAEDTGETTTGTADGQTSEAVEGQVLAAAQGSSGVNSSDRLKEVIISVRERKTSVFYNVYVVLILTVFFIVISVELVVFGIRKLLKKDKKIKTPIERRRKRDDIPLMDFDIELEDDDWDYPVCEGENSEWNFITYDPEKEEEEQEEVFLTETSEDEKGEAVIRVEDVTMEFHLSSSNPSGLKDYLIQMVKRQVSYRKLYALYHVSFNIYKGEVVGIIGTNGSGKSTLLKIVSGALKPTEGKVEVNRKKVQLLTLGTGFDMELTARENVYLNGSIIGYSKKFLDEHYQDIVEFAELSDFMEEKVKNFSSGMVSRLGFAIATAGDAAEILILDEVLSVGDEFFKQKSLQRIKAMIHGGSTVLMVSHGMATILEHCTKCVWIEKGSLRMVGEPEVVCGAYRKMRQ